MLVAAATCSVPALPPHLLLRPVRCPAAAARVPHLPCRGGKPDRGVPLLSSTASKQLPGMHTGGCALHLSF